MVGEPVAAVALPRSSCPAPLNLTLQGAAPIVLVTADFTPAQLNNQVGFNYGGTDKQFLYTFRWDRRHKCCQITSAVLTLVMKANSGGQSSTSSDAGNDSFAMMHLGVGVPGNSAGVYNHWPFNPGQGSTRTLSLNAAGLAIINQENHLSLAVQDDTMVQAVTLQLSGCCLND